MTDRAPLRSWFERHPWLSVFLVWVGVLLVGLAVLLAAETAIRWLGWFALVVALAAGYLLGLRSRSPERRYSDVTCACCGQPIPLA